MNTRSNPNGSSTNGSAANGSSTSTTTGKPARRKRPHPARRARRSMGAAGVGGMLLMTGYMAVNGMPTSAAVTTANMTATAGTTANLSTAKTANLSTAKAATATAATPAKVAHSTTKASG